MTHICVSKLTIIGSDNGLSPDRRQAIILTNAGILLIGPLGTNFSEILIEILTFSVKKMRLKVSSAKRRPFSLSFNVLTIFKQSYYGHSTSGAILKDRSTSEPIHDETEQEQTLGMVINTLRPRQNGRHFAGDIFKCIFLNENAWIQIKISLKFVPQGPVNNIPALVQIMAWRRPGDKPLSGPMMVGLPTHICVTRPQWVNKKIIDEHLQNTD